MISFIGNKQFSALVSVLQDLVQVRKEELAWLRSHAITKLDLSEMENRIMAKEQEVIDALAKVDVATNKLAENVQAIAETAQTISNEIDAFLDSVPVGTVVTDEQVAKLSSLATRAQVVSDASTAQVDVLKAIAAKGAVNPVPVPVPPPLVP